MNRADQRQAIAVMLRTAATLSTDLCAELGHACKSADEGETMAAIGRIIQVPEMLTLIGSLIESVQQLNAAPVVTE